MLRWRPEWVSIHLLLSEEVFQSQKRNKIIFLVDPNSITRGGKIIFSFSLKLFNRWKGHTVSSPDQVKN